MEKVDELRLRVFYMAAQERVGGRVWKWKFL